MNEVTFPAQINGQECQIKIDIDPSWGKMQQLIDAVVVSDGKGGQRVDINKFFNKILEIVVIDGFPFAISDKVKLLQVPISEMSYILGEILKLLPLQKYFENMGMNQSSLLAAL